MTDVYRMPCGLSRNAQEILRGCVFTGNYARNYSAQKEPTKNED